MSLDIHEEDSKGIFVPVHMDKDCFKLRLQTRRKLTLTVSQPSSETSILIMRFDCSKGMGGIVLVIFSLADLCVSM